METTLDGERPQLAAFFNEFDKNIIKKPQESTSRFFQDLGFRKHIYQQYKSHGDRFLSSDFSFFSYMDTSENALSDYLAMMLDTNGPHGQKGLFLNLFIEFLHEEGLKEIEKLKYSVGREYPADGRIDIFLHKDDTAIIIENKPWTVDQDGQLARYRDSVKDAGTPETKIFIVYLSPGHDPSEDSLDPKTLNQMKEGNTFRTISLYDLGSRYLRKAYQCCESEKFRYFLHDFIDFLENGFYPTKEANE